MKTLAARSKRFHTFAITLALAVGCFGCSTPMQTIGISSSPSGAKVTVNGEFRTYTPVVVGLSRKKDYEVVLTREGYEPYAFSIKHKINYSGWIIGNALWGGLIGLTVDAATGEFYQLSTKEPHPAGKPIINVKLKPATKEVSQW
jgi:hypothetical protein